MPRTDRELDRLLERGEDRRSRPTLSPEQKEAATRARDETARRFEAAATDTEGRADVQAMDPYRTSVERARDRAVAAIAEKSRRASESAQYRDRLAKRWMQGFENTDARVSLPSSWTGPEQRAHAKGRAWRKANPPPTEDARVQVEAVTARGRTTRFDLPADPEMIRKMGNRRARQDLTTFYAVRGGEGETGPFGPIHRQYRHDAQGAIARLTADRTGEAVAALRHPQVGDIDLVWGEAPSATREGYGLAKIVAKHPEVLPDLQGFLLQTRVNHARSGKNRLRLESEDGVGVVRLAWDGEAKTWLLTAYEHDADSGARTDTTAFSPADDTASRRAGATSTVSARSRDSNAGAGSGATIDTAAVAPADDTASRETGSTPLPDSDADGNTTSIRSPDKPAAIRDRPIEREEVVRQLRERLRELGLDESLSLAFPPQLFGEPTDGGPPIILDGEYVAEARLIKIAMDAADPLSILDHEAVHGLRDLGLFDDREWEILVRAAKARPGLWEAVERDYRPHGYTESQLEEEVVARLVEWRSRQKRAHPQSGVERLLQRIGDFFRALANWARGVGLQSPEGVLERMDRGEIGARAPGRATPEAQAATAGPSVEGSPSLYALRGPFANSGAPGPRKVTRWLRETLAQASTQHLHRLLPAIPMRPLLEEMARGMPSARRYLYAKERMDALRNRWHAKTSEVVKDWAAIRGTSQADNDALMRLMHDSTLAQVDPSLAPNKTIRKGNQEDRRNYAQLRRRWERLSPEARAMYARVRDTYGEMADAMEAAIVANLRGARNAALRKAEADLAAERQRITRADMTADQRAEATAKAERLYAGRRRRAELQTNARIYRLRQKFEANRLKGPYFPLARFGDFIVTARDKKTGEVVSFSRFESVKQRDAHAAELRREGYAVKAGKLVEGESLKSLVDPRLVADITGVLEKGDVDPAIQDQVWQMYLQTLPDRSLRTRRIHRKGRAGYDQDAMRAFSSHLFHGAHQLARLRYALPLSEHLRAMETEAEATGSPDNAVTIVNELTKRHAFLMNPQGSQWAHMATSAAFVWFLGASPAAATVNLTQTVVMGVPILAAYDGRGSRSVGRAIKELNRALVDFTAGKGHAAASSRLTAEEKAALRQAYETGVIDRTQAYDLAGVAESGVEYRHHWHTWMSRIGWFFHHAERLNREVTYLAGYRMAKAKGENAAGAGRRAADLTWKTHFDYQNTSRPRLMYNDWMKVFLIFRNFQINMLYRLFRDSHTLLTSADKADRREALMQLGGTTGMMMAMAGITGTWGFGIASTIASLFFPDEEDVEQLLKRGMQAHLPGWMVGMLLDGVPGYLSRTALSERIGMPNLWFRPPLGQPEGVELYQHYLNGLLGPAFAIPSNVVMGLHRIQEGHVWRGVETAVPKFVRDPMRALRFAREGALTYRGDALVERFDPAEILIQGLGFTPARLSERYDTNGALRRFERVVTDRRSRLMGEYYQALRREDRDRQSRILEEMQAFNAAYPMYPITADSLRRSIRSRLRTTAQTDGGVRINPRLLGAARETVAAPVY